MNQEISALFDFKQCEDLDRKTILAQKEIVSVIEKYFDKKNAEKYFNNSTTTIGLVLGSYIKSMLLEESWDSSIDDFSIGVKLLLNAEKNQSN